MLSTIGVAIIGILAGVALMSCGNSGSQSKTAGQASSAAAAQLQDGTYLATYANLDSHGWQEFLQVKVQGHKIAAATFDAINAKDQLKTKDPNYNATMKKVTGTNPDAYTKALDGKLLSTQTLPVDAVTGATESSKDFNELAAKIEAAAKSGDTAPVVLPQNTTYTAQGKASQYGWAPYLAVTFLNGKISSVKMDQVKMVNGKVTDRQSTDTSFQAQYKKGTGKEITAVFEQLDQQLLQTGDPSKVDVVSSATEVSNYFKELAGRILAERVSVSPATISKTISSNG
jgi:major membrane immunogen (membrane-anchored lipoprotein)